MGEGNNNKRRDPRVPLVLRVEYPGTPNAVLDATENLSSGGLFLRTDRVLPAGSRLALQIGFPGLLEPFEVEVEVVRSRPAGADAPPGLAVKIPVDRVDDRHKLARLAETARSGLGRPRAGFRVLVVEDNAHVVEMYDFALKKLRGAEGPVDLALEYAANGHDGLLRLAAKPKVDLVITDLFMPVMDGFTLVERMKGDPETASVPILVISAGGHDARARAVDLGVDVYLQKPVQFADILATVRTLLKIRA